MKKPRVRRVWLRKPKGRIKNYQLWYYVEGSTKPITRSLDCSPDVAEEIYIREKNAIARREFELGDAFPNLAEVALFEDFCEHYLKYRKEQSTPPNNSISPSTVEKDDEALRHLHRFLTHGWQMSAITGKVIDEFVDRFKSGRKSNGDPYSPNYINIIIRHLKSAFNWGIRAGYLKENPFVGKQVKTAGSGKIIKYLLPHEIEIVRQQCKRKPWIHRKIVDFDLWTGLRREELLNVKSSDFITMPYTESDGTKWQATMIDVTGKGSRQRLVPASDAVVKIKVELEAIRDDPDKLASFIYESIATKDHTPYFERAQEGYLFFIYTTKEALSKMFRRLINGTGINANFHSLRHTFATNYLEAGGDLKTLSEILGHTSVSTTEIYGQITSKKKAQDINRLTAI